MYDPSIKETMGLTTKKLDPCHLVQCKHKRPGLSKVASLRAGSRLGFMREMQDASGKATRRAAFVARAWGEVGGAGRRESLLLLL